LEAVAGLGYRLNQSVLRGAAKGLQLETCYQDRVTVIYGRAHAYWLSSISINKASAGVSGMEVIRKPGDDGSSLRLVLNVRQKSASR